MNGNNKKKTNAIWGAGLYGGRFAVSKGIECIGCFIDKKAEIGTSYLGKNVLNPELIDDITWKDMKIYVPFNYYDEIKQYLMNKGLKEKRDFVRYGSSLMVDETRATQDFARYKKEIQKNKEQWKGKTIIWGRMWQKKEYIDFLRLLCHKNPEDYLVVSEAVWQSKEETERILELPSVVGPVFSDEESLVISSEETHYCDGYDTVKTELIDQISTQIQGIFSDAKKIDCNKTAELGYEYVLYTICELLPKQIICFGSVAPIHEIISKLCDLYGIRVVYTHQGIIYGTIAFDVHGEMGKSLPAIDDKFKKLDIDLDDKDSAREIWNYLCKNGFNRKVQPKGEDWKSLIENNINNRPIIFYAGQNDAHSHMVPYTEETKKYHSPLFRSSFDAAVYLAKICKKNDWGLLYKPHPMYSQPELIAKLPENVNFVEFGDINEMIDYSDVTVTILSSTNYVALIRNKPVVMLGYNQIRGKGCAYEAYDFDSIEPTIQEALKYGFTDEQKENFTIHLAQLFKYYLYDDLQPRDIRYGKTVPDGFDGFYDLARKLEVYNEF